MERSARHLIFIASFIAISSGWSETGFAKTDKLGKVWIHIDAQNGAASWKARALESTVGRFLQDVNRVRLTDEFQISDSKCRPTEVSCVLKFARDHGADLVLLGQLTPENLKIQSFDTQTFTQVDSADITFGEDVSLEEFRGQVYHLVKPFVQFGGLWDKQTDTAQVPFPFLYFISGTLWAFALIACRRLIIPRLRGIDHITHLTIVPVLQTWLAVAMAKLVAVSLALLPLILLAKGASVILALSPVIIWGFLMPFLIIAGCRLFSSWIKKPRKSSSKIFSDYIGRPSIDLHEPASRLLGQRQHPYLSLTVAMLIFGILGTLVVKAVRYDTIYQLRMRDMKQKYEQEKTHASR